MKTKYNFVNSFPQKTIANKDFRACVSSKKFECKGEEVIIKGGG